MFSMEGDRIMNQVKNFNIFIRDVVQNRQMLFVLSKNDFKAKYSSSILGSFWGFVQPLVTILVMWFVFQVGLKNPPQNDVPFIVWFVPAYLAWAYFSEALASVTNSIIEYQYLVRKVNFRVSIIPLVKVISSSFVHVAFIAFIFFVLLIYKVPFSIYNLQVVYYFFSMVVLLIGFGWMLSALTAFAPDIATIVNVFIQIGFWATPIFWSPATMSPVVQFVLKLNPMFYICQGYRDSFINHIWFWEHGYTTVLFWVTTLVVLVSGALIFKKIRPHFADIL